MLNFAKSIKTIIDLSALSLSISYLLTDKLIELDIIKTNFNIGILLIFLFIFPISILLLNVILKLKQNATINNLNQNITFGKRNKQRVKSEKNSIKNTKIVQNVSLGEQNKQDIDIS